MYRSSGEGHLSLLEDFMDQGYIEDVVGLVMAGKEATVYCCRAGPAAGPGIEFVAAKVYRGKQYRFKNDAVYREARSREMGVRGSALRAFENRKSAIGREIRESLWQGREYEVLTLLYNAGSDVPRPIASANDVVLMEYIGDEEDAAPQLLRVRLEPDEAGPLFQRIMNNIELWLRCDRIHGDLSPHNILYWQGEPRIIDFPQATDPRFNRSARELLSRDIANVCRFFQPYGIETDAQWLADDLWRRFMRAEL